MDLLSRHKADIIALLAIVAFERNHFGIRALVPTSESIGEFPVAEPGLEEPCAIRRGLMVAENGVLLHFCVECGRFGRFGVGVSLRQGRMADGIAASIGRKTQARRKTRVTSKHARPKSH